MKAKKSKQIRNKKSKQHSIKKKLKKYNIKKNLKISGAKNHSAKINLKTKSSSLHKKNNTKKGLNKITSRTKSSIKSSSLHKKKLVLFVVKFFVIFGVANAFIELADLNFLTTAIAQIAGGFLGFAVNGSAVIAGAHSFLITNSCTGLVSASILGAIIFSLKKPSTKIKLTLFIWGAIALLLFNIPRVMLVLLAAQNGFDAEIVHEFTWFVMSAIVLAIWYFGTKRITKIKEFSELL